MGGPDAPIAALIASLLAAIAAHPGSPACVEPAYAQALVCAVVFLLLYAFKLGFLATFLSEPVLAGFIVDATGAAARRETIGALRERGVTFAVARATPHLRHLLDRYGLTRLTYYDSNEAATAAYRKSDHG